MSDKQEIINKMSIKVDLIIRSGTVVRHDGESILDFAIAWAAR